jgi:hypothetical protein
VEPNQGLNHQIVMRNLHSSELLHSTEWYTLPTFRDNLSVPSSRVKKFKRTAQLKLTDTIFFLGICPLSDFLKKQDIFEAGSVSFIPIFKSQEIQKNRAQLTSTDTIFFFGTLSTVGVFKEAGHFGSWLCFYQSHLQESRNPKEQSTTEVN